MVRFLYRGDIHDAAIYLNEHHGTDSLAFSGSLAGPWDQLALSVDLDRPADVRWFDPRRALLFPAGGGHLVLTTFPPLAEELHPLFESTAELVDDLDSWRIYSVGQPNLSENLLADGKPVRFSNGLALTNLALSSVGLLTEWRADALAAGLSPQPLISNPPPPGVGPLPRLMVFAHLIDAHGNLVAGDDGLWVDPYTLRPGDTWVQMHQFSEPLSDADLEIGLYDQTTGVRVSLVDGDDRFLLRLPGR
jgi:hypothetical protein